MSIISIIDPVSQKPLVLTENALMDGDKVVYAKINGAYRVTGNDNYANNFGFQWNRFVKTQIDTSADNKLSYDRLMAVTGWDKEDLSGKNILEAGSGAGRFSQVILDYTKAELYSIDYSSAVEANFKNNGTHKQLHLFQASIYQLPFQRKQFDKVVCFGVLQHTHDVRKAVQCLIDMVKPGGEIIVDFYPINGWWTKLHAKYLLRPFTRKMSHEKLYNLISNNADRLINAYHIANKLGGKWLTRFVPVCDIEGTLPKAHSAEQLKEMVVLDTFDMFSPAYDQPQRISNVVKWFRQAELHDVWGGMVSYGNFKVAVVKGKRREADK